MGMSKESSLGLGRTFLLQLLGRPWEVQVWSLTQLPFIYFYASEVTSNDALDDLKAIKTKKLLLEPDLDET